jgi:ureidoglycolate hydrolase
VTATAITPARVRLERLSEDAFSPFGDVLGPGRVLFPATDDGRIGLELIDLAAERFDPHDLRTIALHFSYNQLFLVLQGRLALVVAPRPHETSGDPAACPLDYEELRAFELETGEGVMIDRGVWHQTVALGGPVRIFNVTRKDPGEPASPLAGSRPYIEHVDLAGRDGRSIRILEP